MTREEQRKLKNLKILLPKILKEKVKKYKFKKTDYKIWVCKNDLFLDMHLFICTDVNDNCHCLVTEKVKPLWIDDLLWDFLQMENNKSEPLSLRALGAFTVSGSEIYDDSYEIKNWDVEELEKIVDISLEHFYKSVQSATLDTFLNNMGNTPYHQELREALTYVHNQQYVEALDCLKDEDEGRFISRNIGINDAIREWCKEKIMEKKQ